MAAGGQRHAPAALPPEMTRYPWYRSLGGPQVRSGRLWKISPLPGFDPRTVQPLESLFFGFILAPLCFTHQDNVYQEILPPNLYINYASPQPLLPHVQPIQAA